MMHQPLKTSRPAAAVLLLASLNLLAAACEGHPPLGEPDASVTDDRVTGTWEPPEEIRSDGVALIRVVRFNQAEYLLVFGTDEPDLARAFFTAVGDALFLNVQQLETARDDGGWDVYRIEFRGSDVLVASLLKAPEPGVQGFAALRARLAARMHDPELYESGPIELRRLRQPAAPTAALDVARIP